MKTTLLFVQRPDGAYVLNIPATMTISIRGLILMLADFTQEQGQKPSGLLMSQYCFHRLCVEAARSAGMLSDDVNSDTPRFNGVPVAFRDPDRLDSTTLTDSFETGRHD